MFENPRHGSKTTDSDDDSSTQHAEFLKAAAIILNAEHNTLLPTQDLASAPAHVSGEVPPPTDEPGEGETREVTAVSLSAAEKAANLNKAMTWAMDLAGIDVNAVPPTPTAPVSFSPHPLPSPPNNDKPNTALVSGVWQSYSSQHAASGQVKPGDGFQPTVIVPAQKGQATLRVAYFFSGIARKASIAQSLVEMCKKSGHGLAFIEIDILVGGAAHNLFDKQRQA